MVTVAEKREPKYWTCDRGTERLYHTTIHDAVVDWWDQLDPDDPRGGTMPETVTVYGFAPMEVDQARWSNYALDTVLEAMEEEYGDPDGISVNDPTAAMREAACTFLRSILAEYRVWGCEEVCQEVVDPKEHVAGTDGDAGEVQP
jgi:hypothetical protein